MGWILSHLDVIVSAAWGITEIWRGKKARVRKASDTARLLLIEAREATLLEHQGGLDATMRALTRQADAIATRLGGPAI